MYSQALSSSFGFLISEYQILSGPGVVSFLLLLRASLNSSLLSSLLGPLCASVLLRSLSTRFLSFKWFWLLCCTTCPRKAWPFSSLVLPCWCLLSLMLFWYEHSLPFVGRIDRTVSALFQHWVFHRCFPIWVFLPLVLSAWTALFWYSLHAALSVSGFGLVLAFCRFFTVACFSVQAFLVSLSYHGGCFMLFFEPVMLCVGFCLCCFDSVWTWPFIPEGI